jgi:protein-S-isoprenylcysteine O-methyltransferase Ste14|tara:strand:- start:606 stop:1043 length:438 start_codon:yes stop_codon:yes gene_type:complete
MKFSFPPVITLACFAMQFILYMMLPLEVNLSLLLGLIILISSVVLIVMAFRELQNNETTYVPDGEPERLVITGPFKFSRNPIYLGMFGILLASAFLMQSISALLIPILFLSIIQNTWIPHEEKKLKEKFPEEWAGYASSTKKWLW